ncbi:MAG: KilA-N domain-containing protein [Thalassotalea sp.]|nr:KilA-N domain-containing protein [Thalassotalea sp.]
MTNLTIISKEIRQRDGLYSLNDLHKASGSDKKNAPFRFIRLEQAQELIEEIERSPDVVIGCKVIKGGSQQGTWVCKELVYAYAMWISPKFHLQVIRAFDQMQQQQLPETLPPEKCSYGPLFYERVMMEIEDGRITRMHPLKDEDFVSSWEKLPNLILDGFRANPAQLLAIAQACNKQLEKRINRY